MCSKYTFEYVKEYIESHSKCKVVSTEYHGVFSKLKLTCEKCYEEFETSFKTFRDKNKTTCTSCSNGRYTQKEVEDMVVKKHGNEYILKSNYIDSKTSFEVEHTKCGFLFTTRLERILNYKTGDCPYCKGIAKNKYTFNKEVKNINDEYQLIGEYIDNHTKTQMKHTCGNITEMTPWEFKIGRRCEVCNYKPKSKGENRIVEICNKYNVKFIPQYKFNDCKNVKPLPFDFAILNKHGVLKFLIEYQGKQHYEKCDLFDKENDLKYRKQNDRIKKGYCIKNNLKFIEIPYWDFVNLEEILIKEFRKNEVI